MRVGQGRWIAVAAPAAIITLSYLYILRASVASIDAFSLATIGLQIGLYAAPFWFFLSTGRLRKFLWVSQALLTMMLWVWFAVVVRRTAAAGTGVNIGATWVMLVGPLITAMISLTLQKLVARK